MNQENSPSVSAPDILTAGAKHMSDRAALRDAPSGERSMKRAVSAFNALEGVNLTETQGWRFMAVLNHARATQGEFCLDDYEDWAAYAALAGESAANESNHNQVHYANVAPKMEEPPAKNDTTGTFSTNDLPMIGEKYYYLSNTGTLDVRRWQSTPQEWKRLATGQVFKTFEACKDAEHTEAYIFHEDDPVPYPEARKLYWYVGLERDTTTWMALCIYYPDDWKKGMELANEIHGRGTAAASEEHAKAKALWRNLSMQRHGTPYGPLHPDVKQSNEPFTGNDEGEEM